MWIVGIRLADIECRTNVQAKRRLMKISQITWNCRDVNIRESDLVPYDAAILTLFGRLPRTHGHTNYSIMSNEIRLIRNRLHDEHTAFSLSLV